MKLGQRRTILGAIVAIICLLPFAFAVRQAEPNQSPLMAEDVFTNIQLFRGVPVDEFWDTMGMFAASLGKDCIDCHVLEAVDNWDAFAEDTPQIQTARRMIQMVNGINGNNFGGVGLVTCFTCHRGAAVPEAVPELALQYGVPPDKPNAMQFFPSPLAPSADEIFDRYIQELGGSERLSNITSFVARGTYNGYETGHLDVPVEIFAQGPDRHATIKGDSVRVYNGRDAWIASGNFPLPLMPLTGGNLAAARVEALLSFPAMIQGAFSQWRVGITIIDDRDVQVVQGTRAGQLPVNLYFDDSGLLVRVVYWNRTAMGMVPTQIDYADYREVSGVRMPFQWTLTWTTGQTTTQLSEVQPNVSIDDARFARPAVAQ